MSDLFAPEDDFGLDTELNEGLVDSRSTLSRAVSTIYGGTVASAVDIGASIFNSLPGTEEVYTEDILSRIGGDALQVYQEHPDAIRTASLVGGAFLPGGLAIKSLNYLRKGSKAAHWFSDAGKAANIEKAKQLFEAGAKGTTEYKQLMWSMRGRSLVNNTIDAAAAEVAIVAAFNAHPYMEDYLKDPVSNFGISLALGAGIGTIGGIIGDNLLLTRATSAIEANKLDEIYSAVRPIGDAMPEATKVQTTALTLKNLDDMIATGQAANKTPANDIGMFYADKMRKDLQLENGKRLDDMLDSTLKELPAKDKAFILDEMASNFAMHGVQKVKFAKVADEIPLGVQKQNLLQQAPALTKVNKSTGAKELSDAVYFPETKQFGSASDIKLHAGASALDTTVDKLAKQLSDNLSIAPRTSYSIEQASRSTPHVEAEYIGWTAKLAKMDEKKAIEFIQRATLAKDDIPQLQAIAVRMASSPALQNLKVKVDAPALAAQAKKRSASIEVGFADIHDVIAEAKHSTARELIKRGFPPAAISKRLNIPQDTVDRFVASDLSFSAFKAVGDLIKFKSLDEAADALTVKTRPLLLRGVIGKADYTAQHANLNARQLNTINKMFISTAMMNSSSPAVKELANIVYERYAPALDLLRAGLSKVNNEAAGSTFWSSADQFVRHMDDLGPVLTVVGKDITHTANSTIDRLLQPITGFMEKVSKNEPALVEFNVAANINAGLSGWRIYKDRQLWQKVARIGEDGKTVHVLEPVTFNGAEFKVATKEADELLMKIQDTGAELYEMREVTNKIVGNKALANTGFWMPAMNPVNKFIAYVHDRAADVTRMVYARTQEELATAIKSFEAERLANPNLLVVTKDNQQWWSYVNGRADPINMKTVDAAKLKSGSGASAIVSVNRDILSEVAGGYEHFINAEVRKLADISMSDITGTLRQYSKMAASSLEGQPLGFVKKILNKPKDAGTSSINILLGNNMLGEYEGWTAASKTFEAGIAKAAQSVSSLWRDAAPKGGFLGKGEKVDPSKMKDFDYEAFSKKLEDAGVVNPFAIYDQATAIQKYNLSKLSDNPEIPKRIIAAGNSMAATMALRFGELAHPIVNLMSMPILTALANAKNLPKEFLGASMKTAEVSSARVMYEGIRAMNSPRFSALNERWEKAGYFKPMVSEATEILKATRKFEKGATATAERILESKFVDFMSAPADYSETLSRKIMMNTGAQLAKRIYPELNDSGVTIFARDFMDKAIGNYSAAQRPVMFQGTVGMALGLFQTYMLTLAQGVYRAVEHKDWKTLAKASMAQATIFGTASMPGFNQVSEMIGEHFSDDHFDLTTGTYRAAGEQADWILYGMPSVLSGTSIYSRGDVDPRFPNVLAGVDNVVAVNVAQQAIQMVGQVGKSLGEGEDTGQALLQALSLQTLSRPLARMSEVAAGGSINRAGNTVSTAEEVWTMNGIAARVFAMRPFEESKLREAQYMNRFYEAADKDRRTSIINELRTAIRNGTNDPERVQDIAEKYMREGGTPTGWRSAYRNAMARTSVPGEDTFLEDLDNGSPFQHMIDSRD
jgi:hypothetical protein